MRSVKALQGHKKRRFSQLSSLLAPCAAHASVPPPYRPHFPSSLLNLPAAHAPTHALSTRTLGSAALMCSRAEKQRHLSKIPLHC